MNPHGCPPDPKSGASAIPPLSHTPAALLRKTIVYTNISVWQDQIPHSPIPSSDQGRRLAGSFPAATLAIFARSLPVPFDAISASLHRPPRGTPPHRLRAPGCRRSSRRREGGAQACRLIARRATNGAPLRGCGAPIPAPSGGRIRRNGEVKAQAGL